MRNKVIKIINSLILAAVLTAVNTNPAFAGETVVLAAKVLPETGASWFALSFGLGMLLIGLGVRKASEAR